MGESPACVGLTGRRPGREAAASSAPAPSPSIGRADRSFDRACDQAGVPMAERAALRDLLRRWRWESDTPSGRLQELLDEYREWQRFCRSRDDPAAARGFERDWRRYARASLGWRLPPQDIDDLVAAFFVRVYSSLGSKPFAWRSPFTVYLRTILVNLARNHLTRTVARVSREVPTGDEQVEVEVMAAPQPSPEEQVLAGERYRALLRALRTLSPLDRQLLRGHLLDGVSSQELARATGIKRDAVYKRVQRARKSCRRCSRRRDCCPIAGEARFTRWNRSWRAHGT